MNIAIIYDSKTKTTATAAEYIKEGIESVADCTAKAFHIANVDKEYVANADAAIIGSPTYMASITAAMVNFLQNDASVLKLAGKLGGAFATENYIHGGAENVLSTILTHEMVYGMMTYSGGGTFGKPVIHLGPVGIKANIDDFKELFITYGQRFAMRLTALK